METWHREDHVLLCRHGIDQPDIQGVAVWQPKQLCSAPQVWQRTNLLSVLWNYCYDHLLVDTLAPGESFIDFIAVSEHARGKGLGSLLMRWAEQTSVAIMLQRLPDQAGQDLCRILLRVSQVASETCADLGGHHAAAPPGPGRAAPVAAPAVGRWHRLGKPLQQRQLPPASNCQCQGWVQ